MIWSEALEQVWCQHAKQPLEYGTLDCCQFVRDYARVMTGYDFGARFKYATEETANKILDRNGGLRGLLESILGPYKLDAHPGDIVITELVKDGYGAAIACEGWVVGVVPGHGIVRYRRPIIAAWSPNEFPVSFFARLRVRCRKLFR